MMSGVVTMNIDYLYEYAELAKHMSFTETARLLNMSQPTLSKHMTAFEKELKLKLFERVGNSLRLTNTGAALLPYAYQVLDSQNTFSAKVLEFRKSTPPRLTISGLTDEGPSTEVLGFLISLLSPKFGSNFLEIKSRYNKDPQEMLAAEEVDLVFDPAPAEETLNEALIDTILIANLPLSAFVSADHPFAQRESISLDDLKNETILKYEGIYIGRSWSYLEQALQKHGAEPKTRSCHCASIAELFAMCADLKSSVLLVGRNFGDRIPQGLRPFCVAVPVVDEDAVVPMYFLFRKDNANPVLREAVRLIREMESPAVRLA